jgi:hypothetical protein
MGWITQRPNSQDVRAAQGKRVLSLTQELLQTTSPAGAGRVATIEIQNPSARLTGSVQIFFEPDVGVQEQDITGYGAAGGAFGYFGSGWDLWAATPGVNGGSVILNRVESVEVLPRSYEWDSGVKVIRVTATMSTPLAAAVAVAGRWYIRVYWEPTVDFVGGEKELVDLFAQCSFAVQ